MEVVALQVKHDLTRDDGDVKRAECHCTTSNVAVDDDNGDGDDDDDDMCCLIHICNSHSLMFQTKRRAKFHQNLANGVQCSKQLQEFVLFE